jgi:ribonuclease BN (tRNA processing enzyme)
VQVTVIGCSGSYPGKDSPASSYLIQADGFNLVLDLGSGSLGALQRQVDLDDVGAICLSHLHPDHCMDLCGYFVARKYHPDGIRPTLPVYGPVGTADRMSRAYGLEPGPGMAEIFDFTTLDSKTQEIGPFRVTAARVSHPIEAYGFRVEYDGRAVAYSGDTGECDALLDLARDVDLFLCEASFLDRPGLPPGVHLTAGQAGEYAARAGVHGLVLTHLVPWNDSNQILAEAKASCFDGHIELAAQGAIYRL